MTEAERLGGRYIGRNYRRFKHKINSDLTDTAIMVLAGIFCLIDILWVTKTGILSKIFTVAKI